MLKSPTGPVIRYYGGKWKLAPWIISHFPAHRVYLEPYGGAASVLMQKKPASVEVYNDLSDEMVNLFRVLRNPVESKELRRLLNLTPYSRSEWKNCYEFSDDPVEQARRTVVLATMSHNPSKSMRRQANGFRTSSSGHHRMPQAFSRLIDNLKSVTSRMQDIIIENKPAIDLISQHDSSDTLIYVDPPYPGFLRLDNKSCYQHEMKDPHDHKILLKRLNECEGYVILSGYESEVYHDLLPDSPLRTKSAVTGAAVPGKSNRIECIWINPKAAIQLSNPQLF